MKKLLIAALLAVSPAAFAVDPFMVNKSSYISGTTQTGCIQMSYLDKVFVGATTAGGTIMLVNSSWTLSAPVISSFSLTVGNPLDFENLKVKGVCYTAASPTNGVSVIYK